MSLYFAFFKDNWHAFDYEKADRRDSPKNIRMISGRAICGERFDVPLYAAAEDSRDKTVMPDAFKFYNGGVPLGEESGCQYGGSYFQAVRDHPTPICQQCLEELLAVVSR